MPAHPHQHIRWLACAFGAMVTASTRRTQLGDAVALQNSGLLRGRLRQRAIHQPAALAARALDLPCNLCLLLLTPSLL
jgi:hypothetical protein